MGRASEPTPGRRQVLQVLAGSVGAGLAAPSLAKGATPHAHAAAPLVEAATSTAAGFLDANQLETIASLAEAIVPGATEAAVAPFVDQLLAADTRERQRDFLAALGALQAESVARFAKPWLSLDAAQQAALLMSLSAGPRSRMADRWGLGELGLEPEAARLTPTARDRFELLKQRIATAYWSSEKGARELGWTGEMIHAEYPTCSHPDGHAKD